MRVKLGKISSLMFVTVLLLCSLSVSALAVNSEVSLQTIDNSITPDEAAEFVLHITNNADVPQTFTLYSFSSSQGWNVDPTPLSDKVIEDLEPGQTYQSTILAQPTEDLDAGIYYLNVEVDGDQEDTQDVSLKVYLGYSQDQLQYLPSIAVEVEMDSEVDPRDSQTVVLNLDNRNSRNLSDLQLSIESEIDAFNLDLPVGLDPLEVKTQEFTVTPSPYLQAKDYSIFFVFTLGEETVKVVEEKITVPAVLSDFAWTVSEESAFLQSSIPLPVVSLSFLINSMLLIILFSIIRSIFIGIRR